MKVFRLTARFASAASLAVRAGVLPSAHKMVQQCAFPGARRALEQNGFPSGRVQALLPGPLANPVQHAFDQAYFVRAPAEVRGRFPVREFRESPARIQVGPSLGLPGRTRHHAMSAAFSGLNATQ